MQDACARIKMMSTVLDMPSDESAARIPLGPVGGYVMKNMKELRQARGLNYKQLAERLRELGREIPTLGLSRIEKGARRVDADDLVALALALDVNPTALLLPRDVQAEAEIELTASLRAAAGHAWGWADGAQPLPEASPDWTALADFAKHARPLWAPPERLQALQRAMREQVQVREDPLQPVVTAIVTSDRGVLVGHRNDGKPPWTFIAGEQEPGERIEDTAIREVKEETGLRIEVGEVIGQRVHPKTNRTMIYVAATPTHGTDVIVGDEEELAEVRWVSLAEADELMASYGMFEPVHEHLARELDEA